MAIPHIDTFSGTAGNRIAVDSASWSAIAAGENDFVYRSGGGAECDGSTSPNRCAIYQGDDTFDNDQEADAVTPAVGSRSVGCLLRRNGNDYMRAISSNAGASLDSVVGGTVSALDTASAWSGSASVHRIFTVTGTSYELYLDASLNMNATDSSIASGSPGIAGAGTNSPFSYISTVTLDNVGGGAPAGHPAARRFGGIKHFPRVIGPSGVNLWGILFGLLTSIIPTVSKRR